MLNVMQVCVEHGVIATNPVREVRQNKETPRNRYVSDGELATSLKTATPLINAYVKLNMLTGLRQRQLLDLKAGDLVESSLVVKGRKGGRDSVYLGEGLKEAVAAALAVRKGKYRSVYLFSTRCGKPYTNDGFRSLWSYAMWKFEENGGEHFTEHDIRAKVGSDSEDLDTAQARRQHQSRSTTNRVYRRGPQKVDVLKPTPINVFNRAEAD